MGLVIYGPSNSVLVSHTDDQSRTGLTTLWLNYVKFWLANSWAQEDFESHFQAYMICEIVYHTTLPYVI